MGFLLSSVGWGSLHQRSSISSDDQNGPDLVTCDAIMKYTAFFLFYIFGTRSTRCHPVATTRCTSSCTLCYHDYIYATSRLHAAHFFFFIIIIIILFLVEAELRKQPQQRRLHYYYPRRSDVAECAACRPASGLRRRMLQQTGTGRSPPRHDKAAG